MQYEKKTHNKMNNYILLVMLKYKQFCIKRYIYQF